ncbi:MAG TPA: hypothetical protein QGG93_00935, partial [Verrucomicrobiota bacterium]|nr:hypothetical protein [Verrucomicrobiota bacterium]
MDILRKHGANMDGKVKLKVFVKRILVRTIATVLLSAVFFASDLFIICAAELTSDDFYKREQVQEIHLTISKIDLDKMKKALPERIYVP